MINQDEQGPPFHHPPPPLHMVMNHKQIEALARVKLVPMIATNMIVLQANIWFVGNTHEV